MERNDVVYYFYVGFFVCAILASFISLSLDEDCDCEENLCEDEGLSVSPVEEQDLPKGVVVKNRPPVFIGGV